MPKNKISILTTRQVQQQAVESINGVQVSIDTMEFIQTTPITTPKTIAAIKSYASQSLQVIFTSMNAVEAVAAVIEHQPNWKIYCLSGTTGELVKKHFGQQNIVATAKDAEELLPQITATAINKNIVFFCGEIRLNYLPTNLASKGFNLQELHVYTTQYLPNKIDTDYNAILFFSPSAVHSFFTNNQISHQTVLFAIGKSTAATIATYSQNTVVVSHTPSKNYLLQQAINYFTN